MNQVRIFNPKLPDGDTTAGAYDRMAATLKFLYRINNLYYLHINADFF